MNLDQYNGIKMQVALLDKNKFLIAISIPKRNEKLEINPRGEMMQTVGGIACSGNTSSECSNETILKKVPGLLLSSGGWRRLRRRTRRRIVEGSGRGDD